MESCPGRKLPWWRVVLVGSYLGGKLQVLVGSCLG